MPKVTMQAVLPAPADKVWAVVGPFDSPPKWHPAIQACTLSDDGKVRTMTFPDGSTGKDRLLEHDDAAKYYLYTTEKTGLPVEVLNGKLILVPLGDRTLFTWEATFEPQPGAPADQIAAVVQQIMDAAAPKLQELFGG